MANNPEGIHRRAVPARHTRSVGAGHQHRHGGTHTPDPALTALRLRRGLMVTVVTLAALALIGVGVWWPRGDAPELSPGAAPFRYVDATITSVEIETCPGLEVAGTFDECRRFIAEVTSGETAGDDAAFVILATEFDKPALAVGDRVVLLRNPAAPPEFQYTYFDLQRSDALLWLAVIFAAVVIALGRWKGVRALGGIAVSFVVLLAFLLPSLLRGNPALPVALAATVLIAFAALYLAHGISIGTTVALVGTIASLAIIAVLAQLFVAIADLTGLASPDAQVLRITADAIDLRGLLVAGIVVGALGVLDDVTVTQVSVVAELRRADPTNDWRHLYRSALTVGRDHIASTVNTLVLAYAGAALPLLLLFLQADRPWARVLAGEVVAIEIVRTLIGSIGLVLAVPVTTVLAAVALAPDAPAPRPPDGPIDLTPPELTPRLVDFSPEEKPF